MATLLLGCTADLPEGTFDCTTGGCPSGWRCFPDNRCYSPSFAGLALYAPCDVDEDCASGTCVRAYDATATLGQCSESCTTTADCPTVEGADDEVEGACAPNVGCLAACTTSDDCSDPDDQSCVVAPMTIGETVCVEFVSQDFSGRRPCTNPGECEAGMQCLRAPTLDNVGVCVWPCSPGGPCPPGATCEAIPSNIATTPQQHACLATCNSTPGSCGPLMCAAFPGATQHCAPPGWL